MMMKLVFLLFVDHNTSHIIQQTSTYQLPKIYIKKHSKRNCKYKVLKSSIHIIGQTFHIETFLINFIIRRIYFSSRVTLKRVVLLLFFCYKV